MEEQLRKIRAYPLSNDDIQAILEPDTKILTYPDFGRMTSIEEAFDPLGRCIFLFLTESPTSGHWLTMFQRKGGDIEYFDSYGDKPEAQREWLSDEQLEQLGQSQPYLWKLLKASGRRVFYSPVQYQKDRADVNTCGRWAVARLICKDMSNHEFHTLVSKSGYKPDDWVALFTYEMLGK
jgi:hypothetical protein